MIKDFLFQRRISTSSTLNEEHLSTSATSSDPESWNEWMSDDEKREAGKTVTVEKAEVGSVRFHWNSNKQLSESTSRLLA